MHRDSAGEWTRGPKRRAWTITVATFVLAGLLAPSAYAAQSATNRNTAQYSVTVEAIATAVYGAEYPDLIAAFEKLHPNIKVKYETQTYQQVQDAGALELSGSNVPALVQVNQGWGSTGKLVQDHLLYPLESYAKQYGWARYQPPALMAVDGRQSESTIGAGTLYGMSVEGSWAGVYYNRALLKRIGQGIPKTLSDFENDLKLAKSAGLIPIALGTQGAGDYLAEYVWFLTWLNHDANVAPIRNVIDNVGSASWDTPGDVWAAKTVQGWEKAGYFNSDYAGLQGPTGAEALFTQGKVLFYVDGDWDLASAVQAMGANVGAFPMPSGSSAHGPAALVIGNSDWVIPARGPDHAQAAELLDFMVSPAAAKIVLQKADTVPATVFPGEVQIARRMAPAIYENVSLYVNAVQTGTEYVPDPDWATPDMLGFLASGLESLLAQRITPSQFAKGLQSDEAQFRSTLKAG